MNLDLLSVTVMTSLVATVAGVVFIAETVIRRDTGPGRIWAVAFFCGIATTVAYAAWSADVGGAAAVASGNTLFVGVPGFVWLGCRRFNDRSMTVPAIVVGVLAGATFVATLLEAPTRGDWAGWTTMVASITILFTAAAIESLRPPMLRIRTGWALSAVFAVGAAFYAARLVAFVVFGPESETFVRWFGSIPAAMVTVVLTIVAAIVTSVLRSHRTALQRYEWLTSNGVAADGVMLARTFAGAAADIVERASWRREGVAVYIVRIEALRGIRATFGPDTADAIVAACRLAARRYAPAAALVGEDEDEQITVCALVTSAADARRQGAIIYRGCVDELAKVSEGLFPFVGVGVAVTEAVGHDLAALQRAARAAAVRAAAEVEASVVFGDART